MTSLLSLELRVLALEEIIVEKDECLASLRFDDFKRLITDSISNNHPMQINQLSTSNVNVSANQINKNDNPKLEQLNNLAIEQEDIERRQHNILVYGVDESEGDIDKDTEAVHDIFDTIKIDKKNIKSIIRF